jgi:hypothetical protein
VTELIPHAECCSFFMDNGQKKNLLDVTELGPDNTTAADHGEVVMEFAGPLFRYNQRPTSCCLSNLLDFVPIYIF